MIPSDVGTEASLIVRFKKAKAARAPWESLWRKAYDYAIPDKQVFYDTEKGRQRNAQVFDETAVKAVQKFATRVQAAITPTWSEFTKLVPGGMVDDDTAIDIPEAFEHMFEDVHDAGELLESYTEKVFHYLHHSNFSSQTFEAFQDLAITNGAMLCEDHEVDGLSFKAEPITNLFLECGPNGEYETTWRYVNSKARDILRLWPDATLPEDLAKEVERKPTAEHRFIEGTIYEPKLAAYHLVVIHEKKKSAIYYRELGESNPWTIFPWRRSPGEIYSRGPILDVLPAILSLNKIWEFVLQNAAYKAAGAWTGSTDGAWNPFTVQIIPGTIIPVGSNDHRNPSLRELPVGGDLQYIDWLIGQKQSQIEQALFANPMGDIDSPVRTLGENMLRVQDMLEEAGASFSLLETEFVAKIMKRVIFLLVRAGKLPEIKVDGKAITLKMTSPLAQARDAQELNKTNLFMQTVAPLGEELMQMKINPHEFYENAARRSGVPVKTVYSEDDLKQMAQDVTNAAA